jgi:hypothetical protein
LRIRTLQPQLPFDPLPKTLLGRVLAGLAAMAIIVMAVFFLTVALVVAGIVLAIAVVRVMWLMHKARRRGARQSGKTVIEADYSVVDEQRNPERHPRKP